MRRNKARGDKPSTGEQTSEENLTKRKRTRGDNGEGKKKREPFLTYEEWVRGLIRP